MKQLQVLALENLLEVWDDRQIAVGEDWRSAIKDAMEQARVAMFLVSANFLTSGFIRDQEVPRILKKRGRSLRVVPIIVEPCPWQRVPWLASIQGRPRDGQALALMKRARAEAALSDIAQEIADLLADEEPKAERMIEETPSMSLSKISNDRVPVLVVTALPLEFKEVCAHLRNRRELTHPSGTVYEVGIYHDWQVAVVEVGMGNAEAAAETERAISFFKPDVALFVGVAGGLKDVRIGDVVASTKVYGYESVKDGDTYQPRTSIELSSYPLEQRARAEARKDNWISSLADPVPDPAPRALVGPIAAGEKLVAARESETAQFLRNQYSDALAVEMEGRGFLAAARRTHGVKAIVIRGISDLLDGKSTADASGSQILAARHGSAFAFAILRRLHDDSDEGPGDESEYGGRSVTSRACQACFYGLPPAVHSPFLGRNAEIERLHSALKAQHNEVSPFHVAMFSSGGVGKTRMALEYAYSFSEYYTGGVFWVVVRDREPLAIWAELGHQISGDEIQLDTEAALSFFKYLKECAKPLLVVLDDVAGDDPRRFAQRINISGAWYAGLPTAACVRILITTRFVTVAGARSIQVGRLGLDAAVELLLRRAGRDAREIDAEMGLADRDLDGHPLALSLAGAYLRKVTNLSISAYRERLRERGLTTELEIAGAHVRNEIPDHSPSIKATYRLSYELLDAANHIDKIAIRLLDLLAFFAPGVELDAKFIVRILRSTDLIESDDEAELAAARLVDISLLEPGRKTHTLVADYVRSNQTEKARQQNCGMLLEVTNSLFPDEMERDSWKILMPGGRAGCEELTSQRRQHITALNLLADKIADRHPRMAAQWMHRLSVSHRMVGMVFEIRGDLPQAFVELDRAYELSKSLMRRYPNNRRWLGSLSAVLSKLNHISSSLGKLDNARVRESFSVTQRLVGSKKRRNRVDGHSGVSHSATTHERPIITAEGAAVYQRAAVQKWEDYLAENSQLQEISSLEDVRILEELAKTHRMSGKLLEENGVLKRLLELDRTNAAWRYDLADSHRRLGAALEEAASGSMALSEYSSALDLLRGLVSEDRMNVQWCLALIDVCWEMASLAADVESRELLEEGRQILEELDKDGRLPPAERSGRILKFELKLGRLPLADILKKTESKR